MADILAPLAIAALGTAIGTPAHGPVVLVATLDVDADRGVPPVLAPPAIVARTAAIGTVRRDPDVPMTGLKIMVMDGDALATRTD